MSVRCSLTTNVRYLGRTGLTTGTKAIGNNTLAGWFTVDNLTAAHEIVEINATAGGNGIFDSALIITGNQVEYCQRSSANQMNFLGATTISANTWYHAALTYDGTTLRGYLNGAANGTSATVLTGTRGNWGSLQIGPCDGEIEDGVWYDAALSADEIFLLYRAALPKRRTNLQIFMPCFAGTATRLIDLSGNANDFANQNTPTDGTTAAAVSWGTGAGRIILPSSTGIAITAAGLVQVTGAAAMSSGATLAPAGLTQCTGAAALQLAKNAAGMTNVSGAAAMTGSAPLVAAGSTQVTGTAVVTGNTSFSITAAGTTNTTGAATMTTTVAPLTAAGLTQVNGSALEGGASPLVGAGMTVVTGSAVVTSNAPTGTANYVHLWRRNRRGR